MFSNFEGFEEADARNKLLRELPPETIRNLKVLEFREVLEEKKRNARFKRWIAGSVILASVFTTLFCVANGDYEAAKIIWLLLGSPVGFLFHVLYKA
ncbi:MAG: hypothetical protein GY855_08850 [candidate division Zixibacteria bacterium]|nr:hypothetical protein [candidate division Zixibacteria bacterium]